MHFQDHSWHFLMYTGHQKRNSYNLLILYHKRKDIFNIVKIRQNKRLYVKLTALYFSHFLIFWNMRTECQREELTHSRSLSQLWWQWHFTHISRLCFPSSPPQNPKRCTEEKSRRWGSGTPNPVLSGAALLLTDFIAKKIFLRLRRRWVLPPRIEPDHRGHYIPQ